MITLFLSESGKILSDSGKLKVGQGKRIKCKLLPKKLVTKIRSVCNQKECHLAFKIVHIMRIKYNQNYLDETDYIPFDCKYKRMIVGSNANYKIYGLLEKNEILQKGKNKKGKTFSIANHQCCKYRINPIYLQGGSELITYIERRRKVYN